MTPRPVSRVPDPQLPPAEGAPGSLGIAEAALVEVAVPIPLRRLFTYRVPPPLRGTVQPGSVVRIPFGSRTTTGFVVGSGSGSPLTGVKDLIGVEDEDLSITGEILDLCRWVADYYLAPLGEVLRSALPAGLGRRTPAPVPSEGGGEPEIVLGAGQREALEAIRGALAARRTERFLLHGVTGSGKTEVYLRAAAGAVSAGGKVLILIPEIALSPQMVRCVEDRFGNRAALWHSALTASRRREVYSRARRGEIDVLVGARSAVFAPLPDLRLVVVDEEHENAYKQSESPRYHARDVAVVRARLAGAVVVLGSATPSLESYANAERGKYRLLRLPHRVRGRSPARVERVSLPRLDREPRPVSAIFSDPLRDAITLALSRGEQCILFLNRRGHSTVVQCDGCREALPCTQCDIVLTWHSVGDQVVCHYCGRHRPTPRTCPACGGELTIFKGTGTQKVASEVRRLWGDVGLLRLDTDSVRKRGALEDALEAFRRREAKILLGTQMVAKGLDFPGVTLVGVINADLQLNLPDFRSAERTFQLLTQVAGRSGRGDIPGRVVFQTNHPDHHALRTAGDQDYESFYRAETAARREPPYPPWIRLVNLMFDGRSEERVIEEAESTAAHLEEGIREHAPGVELLGPAPQPFSRLKGRHRWHLTLRGEHHRELRRLAGLALERGETRPRGVRIAVDVDPVSLL